MQGRAKDSQEIMIDKAEDIQKSEGRDHQPDSLREENLPESLCVELLATGMFA